MGRLELPLPDLGKGLKSLEEAAREMQEKIRREVPHELSGTVVVKVFTKGKTSGLAIEYDDRAESLVYMAMEYPRKE